MKDEENKEFYIDLRKIAKMIEKHRIRKRGLRCIVVDNPFRGRNNGDDGHCFIITQPVSGRRLSKEEFEELLEKARNHCNEKIRKDGFLFGIGPVVHVESIKSWFAFLDKQEKHPILCGVLYGATDVFLSEVIYGKKLHKKIIRAFEYKYGKNFIQKCQSVWKKEEDRRKKLLDDSNISLVK